ncbi:hypothetical protein SAMN05192588_0515 [Nonlabens sp. Hel1_33_55]|uniref:hypothetical protein n=1 Tax=Nonlabens sp. Hel1_33_55 TaxID=1336802 RepID=UPI000875C228|nr:hypothetical protein [Nonlabens sp. Hel1_33_55]SCX97323.1 hypothetical protein SAMN05192588_0515 [Nonlabens sp. Hel1_33_55]
MISISTTILHSLIGSDITSTGISTGTAIGCSIAVVCSWTRNKSIKWAILAGIFSWFYVIYFYFTRTEEESPN